MSRRNWRSLTYSLVPSCSLELSFPRLFLLLWCGGYQPIPKSGMDSLMGFFRILQRLQGQARPRIFLSEIDWDSQDNNLRDSYLTRNFVSQDMGKRNNRWRQHSRDDFEVCAVNTARCYPEDDIMRTWCGVFRTIAFIESLPIL